MNIIKRAGIVIGCTIAGIYLLFLILPFILTPVVNGYVPQINEEIKKSTGLISSVEDIRLVTTPKFTIGLKVGKFGLKTPDNKEILNSEDFQVKMSLLPLLAKRIEVDLIKLQNVDLKLGLNKDGSFEIEKYLPEQEEVKKEEEQPAEKIELPFGLRLSNHLPDIRIGNYNITFSDLSNGKSYIIKGNKTDVTDFIFNKSVKISSNGSMTLAGREQFKYNLKVNNKIMPEIDLHDMIFNPELTENKNMTSEPTPINILEILKGLYDYKITANANTDITLTPDSNNGYIKLDNLSIAPNGVVLPPSNANILFKGDKININSEIYTAKDEKSTVIGTIQTGKKTNIDVNFKSGAELSNLVRIINAIALTFNIKDLQTLSANGKLDVDFNIKSDLKTVNSDGYLKIPYAKINYGLYNITIDKINSDITLANNDINIKNISFEILGQPLKLYGLVKQDASADLHLIANNLSLKGLIVACGQAALLKENQVNSGLVNLKADIVGKLDSIKPTAKVVLNGLNIKNIPSNTVLKLPLTEVNIITDGVSFSGNAVSSNIAAVNPVATVNIPKLNANIREDVIEIPSTPVKVEKINFNVSGKIKNYMKEKIGLEFATTGDIKSTLTGDMNAVKQTLNLNYATTQNSLIVVPMFDKSKMVFNCNLGITGNMANPIVKGSFNIPSLNMPEIPVTMENVTAKINGEILNGSAVVPKFTTGEIVANDITTDFSMKGENFYLKNLKGTAFDGKFNGDIIYNMSNAKTAIDFKGDGMNAEKAIAGAAGIKNALSGTLEFVAKMNLVVLPDYNDMMRTLKGNLTFKINNGAFGKIGRLENFLQANNIVGNTILKTTVNSFSNIAAIKNSAAFDYISGAMTFNNGWADISNIKSTGKSVAYFITGKYNLINGTANVNILGRLDGKIVKLLGPVGELSAEKLLSYIPKFGELTAKYFSELTTDPDKERVKDIPALSAKEEGDVHKDFKVIFNGGVESTSSVKSFKWLSKADTSAIEQQSVKETIKSLKTNLNTDVDTTVQSVKSTVESVKNQTEALKDAAKELRSLFKSTSSAPKTESAATTQAASTAASQAESNVATQAESTAATETAGE